MNPVCRTAATRRCESHPHVTRNLAATSCFFVTLTCAFAGPPGFGRWREPHRLWRREGSTDPGRPHSTGCGQTTGTSTVSAPGAGWRGTRNEQLSDTLAMAVPSQKMIDGLIAPSTPKAIGTVTAAMWLMVKDTEVVAAMSAGSAIFWK